MISNCIVKREDIAVRFCTSVSADPRVGCGWFGIFRPPVALRMVDEECHESGWQGGRGGRWRRRRDLVGAGIE